MESLVILPQKHMTGSLQKLFYGGQLPDKRLRSLALHISAIYVDTGFVARGVCWLRLRTPLA